MILQCYTELCVGKRSNLCRDWCDEYLVVTDQISVGAAVSSTRQTDRTVAGILKLPLCTFITVALVVGH